MRNLNNEKFKQRGITLIALIITIIVLIILAAVSVNLVIGDGGIISRAELAAQMQENATVAEEEAMNELLAEYESILGERRNRRGRRGYTQLYSSRFSR